MIVLGNEQAKALFGPTTQPVGLIVEIAGYPFQVIGVTKRKLQLWSYAMPDDYLAWIPANTFITLAQPTHINGLVIVPNEPEQLPFIKKQLLRLIAINHHLDPGDENILHFDDSYQVQNKTNQVFRGMEIFLGILGSLTLATAGIGIANVMFISVRRATREIGIRMAVGAKNYQILIHYIIESFITTLIGGVIGLFVANAIIAIIRQIPIKHKFLEFIGTAKPVLSPSVIIIVIIVLGITGFLAGFFPAKKAANIHPAEALRHE